MLSRHPGTTLLLNDAQAAEIRSQFPILRHKVSLNSCSQGALCEAVEAGLREYLESWHAHGSPWDLWVDHYEQARTLFARFIGADADEVAIVTSASEGINSLASALLFRERKKVVMGEFEFPTMGHIWLAQRPRGAEIEFIAARDNRVAIEDYAARIDRNTLIVPLTRVCFANGFRSPVREVVAAAHDKGALVLLDDFQDAGTRPVDVKALGVDFYVTGTLKYLLGSPGLAFLYVRRELIPALVPTVTGWFGQANPFAFDVKHLDPAPSARRFQSGSPPVPSIYSTVPGLKLLMNTGMENVAERVQHLTRKLMEGAEKLGIESKTPADSVGPLVVLRAHDAEALVKKLAERDIAASARRDGLRISFHLYNSDQDVQSLLMALEHNLDLLVTKHPAAAGH